MFVMKYCGMIFYYTIKIKHIFLIFVRAVLFLLLSLMYTLGCPRWVVEVVATAHHALGKGLV